MMLNPKAGASNILFQIFKDIYNKLLLRNLL